MREYTSRINTFNAHTLESVTPTIVLDQPEDNGMWGRVRHWLIRTLLRVPHGVVYAFSLRERIVDIRIQLEKLKQRGYISFYGEGTGFSDYPRIELFGIFYAISEANLPLRTWGYNLPGHGKELAMEKALYEAIERDVTYSDTQKQAPYTLGDAAHLFPLLPTFSSEQKERDVSLALSASDMKHIPLVTATCITGGGNTKLPLQAFYWGKGVREDEKFFQDRTTSGSGLGASYEMAAVSAICELIERDHFLLYWLSGISPRQIVGLEELPFYEHIRNARERYGLEVYFLDISYDYTVSTILTVIIDPVLNIVALGNKSSLDPAGTLKGAYLEALATLTIVRSRGIEIPKELLRELKETPRWGDERIDRRTRINMYNSPEGIAIIRGLLLANENTITYTELTERLGIYHDDSERYDALINDANRVQKEKGDGYHLYLHEFPKRREFKQYHAVHAFVPALLKLYLTERFVTPNSERLREFCAHHGKVVEGTEGLNPLPHPFS